MAMHIDDIWIEISKPRSYEDGSITNYTIEASCSSKQALTKLEWLTVVRDAVDREVDDERIRIAEAE